MSTLKGKKKESDDGAVRRYIRDLYRSDLDRHLWALPVPKNNKKRRKKKERDKRRRAARLLASAAGALGAAGASYWLYRRIRKSKRGDADPQSAPVNEAGEAPEDTDET